ncbi:hypothetical protein ACUW02_001929 [Pseudomonas aeruginosa]|uniref:hypothetical protein n=1 Tax=Pseudomonas aeruginosa TaxID=287 RepID=UPI000E3233DB|nr:hypothetical protein [Pseudomonas aeruginosa]ELK4773339.1 hypothetical protein [Pseudomonas aeruginosa]ELM1747008.1 hypothetical protein [Pseudomonas aeruginosa]NQC22333.1 hypothetical protein [Pseudomonas aeruginosa]WIK51997.1 hypothetical protein OI903_21930 [Pseudomonas aeruginosa]HEJ9774518.1 hypothetical protein [Pseudomonas aeruginosa]
MEQAMRQEFEDRFPIPEGIEWRDTDYFPVQTDNVHVYVALAGVAARYTSIWQAWQASRAALRVELPKPHPAFEYAPRTKVFNITDVEIALQQAGIEVKHGTA